MVKKKKLANKVILVTELPGCLRVTLGKALDFLVVVMGT